jgi:hypothetical protein
MFLFTLVIKEGDSMNEGSRGHHGNVFLGIAFLCCVCIASTLKEEALAAPDSVQVGFPGYLAKKDSSSPEPMVEATETEKSAVFSQVKPVLNQNKDISRNYYVGKLGDEHRIQMDITTSSEHVKGSYFFESSGMPLVLEGRVDEKGEIILSEMTEVFRGRINSSEDSFEGKLVKPKRRKSSRFNLKKTAEYLILETVEGAIEVHTEFPLLLSVSTRMQKTNIDLLNAVTSEHYKFVYEGKKIFSAGGSLVPRGWERRNDISIKYYSEEIVSLFSSIWEYTGGAHGNTRFYSTNYWVKNGSAKILTLSDLFLPESEYLEVLSDHSIKDLRKQGASFVKNGQLKTIEEEEFGAFWIKPQFLGFAFHPRFLGAANEGSYVVRIPYGVLSQMIDPRGPLGKFAKGGDKEEKKEKKRKRRTRRR